MSLTFDIPIPPLSSTQLDAIRSQHQAAARFAGQSELHAILAGKALLKLRRSMRAREWREWVAKARVPGKAIAKYIRAAEALEMTAYLAR